MQTLVLGLAHRSEVSLLESRVVSVDVFLVAHGLVVEVGEAALVQALSSYLHSIFLTVIYFLFYLTEAKED